MRKFSSLFRALLVIGLFNTASSGLFAQGQGNTFWKINGNTITGNERVGSLNTKDLILISDGSERLRLNTMNEARFKTDLVLEPLVGEEERMLIVDKEGRVRTVPYGKDPRTRTCLQVGTLDGTVVDLVTRPSWDSEPGILFTECPSSLRVGIGTKEPQAKLDIRGNLLVSESITATGNLRSHTGKLGLGIFPNHSVDNYSTSPFINLQNSDNSSSNLQITTYNSVGQIGSKGSLVLLLDKNNVNRSTSEFVIASHAPALTGGCF